MNADQIFPRMSRYHPRPNYFKMIPNFFLAALAAYLLGSIPSGVIVSRFFARRDVRGVGSGHTGTVNTFRAAGLGPAVFVFLADTGKAIIAVEFARWLTTNEWLAALAGVIVIIGHCLPIFARFHGGMGLAPAGAALFVLNLPALVVLISAWFLFKFILKQSRRASIVVALSLPLILLVMRADAAQIAFGIGAGAVIIWRHR